MRTRITIMALAITLAAITPCPASPPDLVAGTAASSQRRPTQTLVPIIRQIDHGQYSGLERQANYALRNRAAWKKVWDEHASNVFDGNMQHPALPRVNFKTEMVIAVFLGTRNNGGHGIAIVQITETSKEIIVSYIVSGDDDNGGSGSGMTTMALTNPYHLVVVKANRKSVRFVQVNGGQKP